MNELSAKLEKMRHTFKTTNFFPNEEALELFALCEKLIKENEILNEELQDHQIALEILSR